MTGQILGNGNTHVIVLTKTVVKVLGNPGQCFQENIKRTERERTETQLAMETGPD